MNATAVWKLPEPLETCDVRLDENNVTTVRRFGNPAGRRLILSHGNGLAIDLYYPFWSLLVDDFDIFLYDIRNHGWNTLSDLDNHNLPAFIQDQDRILRSVDEHFGARPKIGVFHSLSALISLLSVSSIMEIPSRPARSAGFEALVLFDPPLFTPSGLSEATFDELAELLARRTRIRGNMFERPSDFVELLNYSPNFIRVVPGVRELMAETTLRKSADGEFYELRCPPNYEAQIVEYARSYAGWVDFTNLPCPVKVLGADPTLPFAYLPTFDLAQMDTVDYDFLPEATHYLQLERPADCVSVLHEFLDTVR